MGAVITEGSTIECGHTGSVTPVATSVKAVLQVAGKSVLAGTLAGSAIANCAQKPPPNSNVPCATILAQSAGPSSVLFVGSDAVLLEDAAGTTTPGAPTNDWSVKDAKQQLLTVG